MADKSKQNKYLFLDFEEGEVPDNEDEENDERADKKKRDDAFIKEWTESMDAQKVEDALNTSLVSDADMDEGSDVEEGENKIDEKPVAMTVTFHDKDFCKRHRKKIEEELLRRYGKEYIDSSDNCIFVLQSLKSTAIDSDLGAISGAISFVFHDRTFHKQHYSEISEFCNTVFGFSRVISHEFGIEIVQSDTVCFEIDTEPYVNNAVRYDAPKNTPSTSNSNQRRGPSNQRCFNCMGEHAIRDCKKPRNQQTISKNRNEFMKSKATKRYHSDIDQFSEFSPGTISKKLRKALGLNDNQLPKHIYNMRKLGYPPGWLAEAKIAHSGVTVYGSAGVVPEEGDEEGEVFEEGEKDMYDIKKLIAFPGFNVPSPKDVVDEWEDMGCPPISEEQSLENMIARLQPNAWKAYKKRMLRREQGLDDSAATDSKVESPILAMDSPSTSKSSYDLPPPKTPEPEAPPKEPVAVNFGTPVIASQSPFSVLPERTKFSVDISDVINFENLPDSTGTYEKMVGSIAKIRNFNAKNKDM